MSEETGCKGTNEAVLREWICKMELKCGSMRDWRNRWKNWMEVGHEQEKREDEAGTDISME